MRASFHPLRDIYAPRFMGQAICDATALYYASSHLSRLAGNLPSQEALQSEATLCRELNKRISCVDTQADDCSIIAVLGLIAADVQLWSQDGSLEIRTRLRSHVRGFHGMIQQRGGWPAIKDCAATFYIHWFDIVSAGKISLGLTPLSRYLDSQHQCASYLELYVYELCAFYQSLSSHQISFMGRLVEPGTLVGRILAQQEHSVMAERSAVLIYLCAASDDLRHSPGRLQYVEFLGKKLAAQDMGPDASLARVLWALIIDFENFGLECPERTWLLSRMLYVAAKLSDDLRRKLDNQLLRFLVSDARDDLVLKPADFEANIWRDIALVNVNEEKTGTTAWSYHR